MDLHTCRQTAPRVIYYTMAAALASAVPTMGCTTLTSSSAKPASRKMLTPRLRPSRSAAKAMPRSRVTAMSNAFDGYKFAPIRESQVSREMTSRSGAPPDQLLQRSWYPSQLIA
mmetsp:Transcript_2776/g.6910  ORF Transcript_2776/g.6910 Transcript_2776/m.6910 type:complete len:114 (+) Transcript_2776:971-1312(+)